MKIDNAATRRALAADYVLGVMQGSARRRFERLVRDDLRFCGAVSWWEQRLFPLLGPPATAAPPEQVLDAVERRIAADLARR
jgi:anti-sigma-K factor RskA